jgi:hypothetical protein
MKTPNGHIYLEILDEYLNGKGIDLDAHHLNKDDIGDMIAFYGRNLSHELSYQIAQYIISDLIENQ